MSNIATLAGLVCIILAIEASFCLAEIALKFEKNFCLIKAHADPVTIWVLASHDALVVLDKLLAEPVPVLF